MRLWTDERPFDEDVWAFYQLGNKVVSGRGCEVLGTYRVAACEFIWRGQQALMRVALEEIR